MYRLADGGTRPRPTVAARAVCVQFPAEDRRSARGLSRGRAWAPCRRDLGDAESYPCQSSRLEPCIAKVFRSPVYRRGAISSTHLHQRRILRGASSSTYIDEAHKPILVRYSLARQSHLACPIHAAERIGSRQRSRQALSQRCGPIWRSDRSIGRRLRRAGGNTSGGGHRPGSRRRASPAARMGDGTPRRDVPDGL